ncbi:HYR domain-containing protein [Pseudophaeobacter sp.]|uniref:HYR domain-containing protein n=1 Tax=Pseudophaeobacter sp. TaxID=1971739 RepID=UPI003A974FAB
MSTYRITARLSPIVLGMLAQPALAFDEMDDYFHWSPFGSCYVETEVHYHYQTAYVRISGHLPDSYSGGGQWDHGNAYMHEDTITEAVIAQCLSVDVSEISLTKNTGPDIEYEYDSDIGFAFTLHSNTPQYAAGNYRYVTDYSTSPLRERDSTAPVLTPPADLSVSTETGLATATLDVTTLGSGDDNWDSYVEILYKIGGTTVSGDYAFPVGDTTVTMDATDSSDNAATQVSFTVRVSDAEAPVITAPANQSAKTALGGSTVSLDVTNLGSVADNVDSDLPITYRVGGTHLDGAYDFPIGETTVTMVTEDAARNEADMASFIVTVVGNAAPVLTPPGAIFANTDPGESTHTRDVTGLGSVNDDADSSVAITYRVGETVLSGAYAFPVGVTTVTMDATDTDHNPAAQQSFAIRVSDAEAPIITAPANQSAQTALDGSSASLDVTGLGSVSDNVDSVIAIAYRVNGTLLDGAYDFPIGETTVTMTAADAARNESDMASFLVTVVGNAAPVITAPDNQSLTAPTGAASVALDVTKLGAVSDDADTGLSITYSIKDRPVTGSYDFPIGVTTVTMDASDTDHNAAAQVSFNVTVLDAEAPVLTAPDNQTAQTVLDGSTVSLDVTTLGSVADNDLGSDLVITYRVGDTVLSGAYDFPIGVTTVTMHAADSTGNAASQVSFTVTILGNAAPVLTAPDTQTVIAELDATSASLDVTDLGAVSDDTDRDLMITYRVGDTVLSGAYDFPIGTTIVTMDATDRDGNTAAQVSFSVIISEPDVSPPSAPTIANIDVLPDRRLVVSGTTEPGALVTITFPDQSQQQTTASGGTSNRAFTRAVSSANTSAAAPGSYSVTSATAQPSGNVQVTATDSSGNTSVATAAIADTTAPDVVISGGPANGQSVALGFDVTVTFSETVIGFDATDITATNATVDGLTGSGAVYTARITGTGNGDISLQVPAASAEDAAGNDTTASNTLVIADTTVIETQKQIAGFMQSRANQLIANQPGLTGFLSGAGSPQGSADVSVTRAAGTFNIASRSGQPIWFNLKGNWSENDSAETRYAFGALGGHITVNRQLLIGAMLQFDHQSQDDGAASVSGTGWMAGPYVVAQLPAPNLYLEGRLLYGETSNRISPFGTYEDDFDTTRVLAQAKLSGTVDYGRSLLTPFFDVSYANEEQKAYTDSLGNRIGAQKIHLRQAAFGLDVAHPVAVAKGKLDLTGGISGIWSSTSGTAVAQTVIPSYSGWRAALRFGLAYTWPNGGLLTGAADYDGLGAAGYESFGLNLQYSFRF